VCLAVSAWLSLHGYDPSHRDAVLGYIRHESGFETCPADRGTGRFLFQWLPPRGFLPGSCPNLEEQMTEADRELHNYYVGFWTARDPSRYMRRCFGAGECR